MYENIAITDINNSLKWTDPIQADANNGKVSQTYPWPAITVSPNSNEKACFAWSDDRDDDPTGYNVYFNKEITTGFVPAVIMYLLN